MPVNKKTSSTLILFFLGPSSKTRDTREGPHDWLKAHDGKGAKKEPKSEEMVFHGLVIFGSENLSLDRPSR